MPKPCATKKKEKRKNSQRKKEKGKNEEKKRERKRKIRKRRKSEKGLTPTVVCTQAIPYLVAIRGRIPFAQF